MRVLVVDDEEPARRRLIRLLAGVPNVTVAGEAQSAREALAAIDTLRPDVLLLDIEMPVLSGLDLVAESAGLPPVIFVTAHDRHAVPAFDVDAADYVLKPVRLERLVVALERAARRIAAAPRPTETDETSARILSVDRGKLRVFDARRLTRFWASDKYTVFLSDGEEYLTAEPLSSLEKRLEPHGFLRVHRAELIRVSAVRSLEPSDGAVVAKLEDGQGARVSRRSVAALKQVLKLPAG